MINSLKAFFLLLAFPLFLDAQLPEPTMVGYWENWNGSRFVKLKNIDDRYNVICIAFASLSGSDHNIKMVPPSSYTDADFKSEMQLLQSQGKKILISIGGQNDKIKLDSLPEKEAFVSSMIQLIEDWGFDGLDIDLEGSSLNFSDINIQNPSDPKMIFMIDAIKEIMEAYHQKTEKKLLLTMAPETVYVQGALSLWAGDYRGAYLPMIEELRDSIDMLNVQLYNSGSMFGLDGAAGGEFFQGTADFIVALTEAVILGFTATGDIGVFSGLPASKVGVALPGCHSYDAVPHDEMIEAINYLRGMGPQPGKYKLKTDGGYPDLKGMMTWSINSDRQCKPSYGFVDTWSKIFLDSAYIEVKDASNIYEQKESGSSIEVQLFKDYFASTLDSSQFTLSNLPDGVQLDSLERINDSIVHILLKGNAISPYAHTITNVKVQIGGSQFASSNTSLSRGYGIVLKKSRSSIPGRVHAEALYEERSSDIGRDWDDSTNYRVRMNNGSWANYEVNIDSTGNYNLNFAAATSPGWHTFTLYLDGKKVLFANFKSTSTYKQWAEYPFTVELEAGEHILQVECSSGWFNYDFLDFTYDPVSTFNINSSAIKLYPNPCSNQLHFTKKLEGQISIYSLDSKLVMSTPINGSVLDVNQLHAGFYLLRHEDTTGQITTYRFSKK